MNRFELGELLGFDATDIRQVIATADDVAHDLRQIMEEYPDPADAPEDVLFEAYILFDTLKQLDEIIEEMEQEEESV